MAMLTPNKIRGYQFQQAGRGTYRSEEVDDFLSQIVESYEQVFKENGELVKKLNILATKLNEYRKDEGNISKALVNAQGFIDKMIEEANKESKKIVAEAEERAKNVDSITNAKIKVMVDEVEGKMRIAYDKAMAQAKQAKEDAYKESETLVLQARQKADSTINSAKETAAIIISDATKKGLQEAKDLKAEIEKEKAVLDNLREMSNQFKTEIIVLYERQIKTVEQMPDYTLDSKLEKAVEELTAEKTEEIIPETAESAAEEKNFDADELILEYADKESEKEPELNFDYKTEEESVEDIFNFDFSVPEEDIKAEEEEEAFDFANDETELKAADEFEDIFSDSGESEDTFRFSSINYEEEAEESELAEEVVEEEEEAPFEFHANDVNIFDKDIPSEDISFNKHEHSRKFDVAFSKNDAVEIEKKDEVLYGGDNEEEVKKEGGFKFFDNIDITDSSLDSDDDFSMDADDVFGKSDDDDDVEGFGFLKNIFGKK